MLGPGFLVALVIAILVYVLTTSILWALIVFILVLLLVGGWGYYGRRW